MVYSVIKYIPMRQITIFTMENTDHWIGIDRFDDKFIESLYLLKSNVQNA